MSIPLFDPNNVTAGIVQFGNVTNTYGGFLQSGGVAYDIQLPFEPDMFQWWRYTGYATAGTIGQGTWFRGFPAGDGLNLRSIVDNGSTGNASLQLDTSNSVTVANLEGGFTDQHLTISGVSTAAVAVVTTGTHGLASGARVVITKLAGNMGQLLNNKTYVVDVLSSTTFALYDIYGNGISTAGYTYTGGGQATKTGPELNVVDEPTLYYLTLGTTVMGADNDVIYFLATKFNRYVNYGDVA